MERVDAGNCIGVGIFLLWTLAAGCGGGRQADPGKAQASHAGMLELLEQVRRGTPTENPYLGDAPARRLSARLAALPEDASVVDRLQLLLNAGVARLVLGEEREAIGMLTEAHELLPEAKRAGLSESSASLITFQLGMAYMRLGETENCCRRNHPESCILPIEGGGVHVQQQGARRAIEYFTEVIEATVRESEAHMEALWLLNVAHMALGEYPDRVAKPHLIPPEAFRSAEAIPRFKNVASRVGLDTFSLSGGAIADDFDDDDDLDLLVSTWDASGQLRFFRNDGDGTFSDLTEAAGLTGLYGGLNMLQADYDNDGHVDAFVLRGAWLFENGRHPNSLIRNNGDGTFTDVTLAAGLGETHYPTQTASWADYDNDGDLDLYVGNESTPRLSAPCQLWRNEGDGRFTDVAGAAGVTNLRFTKSVIWGDYDGDRFPDLYVSNLSGRNRLYRNDRDGTFTDVAEELGVTEPLLSFPAWFWDVDNDGRLDLFVSAYATRIGHLAASLLGREVEEGRLPRIYRGTESGGFEHVGRKWGLVTPSSTMGSNFGDLDNDGRLDFYLGTGDPEIKNIMPNAMFLNRDGRAFADVTTAGGFGHLQKGHAVVFADLDNDGDQDVFEQMGGAYPGDRFHDALYENPGFGNHWINVHLVGVRSNRSAIGARIRVDTVEDGRSRSIYKYVNSGGTFGANPLRQTIGLGRASRIERLEIFWPTTGVTQTFEDLPLDRWIRITEDESTYETLTPDRVVLGG